ncbi:MAG: serine/threonine protein kinase [Gammaproteobacteria bacterium]|nr:MAG: serine/threonine protein kinase [Gammaproteobacteria bacterium]
MTGKKPAMIGRFELVRRLGEGLQGKVYLGHDRELDRKVALKVITPANGDTRVSEGIADEARIAARISHPTVVPIFEVVMLGETPVLVFEFVDGMTLREYIREHGRFGEREALSLLVRIAAGLRCAHEQGVMHLDLSPRNIMIDQEKRPRIMDFGLARLIASIETDRYRNEVAGTPRYMSPEQVAAAPLTPASDIFTLGLVFYELLTGTPAINEKGFVSIIHAVETVKIDWARLHALGVSPEVVALLREMLQRDPARRIASASELVPELDNVIEMLRSTEQGSLALEFLMRRLQRRPEFPACSHAIAEINRLTAEDSGVSFDRLGSVIVRDYALTNRIIKIANSVAFNPANKEVKTISQAIARLGLRLVRTISNGLLLYRQDGDDPGLKDLLASAFVCALVARHIAGQRDPALAEEAFMCALFHDMGSHLLAFYLPEEHREIGELMARGRSRTEAERAVLMLPAPELGKAVAARWHFPQIIIECMNRLPEGVVEPFDTAQGLLLHTANFASELCELVRTAGEGEDLLLGAERFLDRHANLHDGDIDWLCRLVSAAAGKFADLAPTLGVSYRGSDFCNRLGEFAGALGAAREERESAQA